MQGSIRKTHKNLLLTCSFECVETLADDITSAALPVSKYESFNALFRYII